MKITLKTTKHDTTQADQLEKINEELEEFSDELYNCTMFGILAYKYNIINEGIDIAKALQKWAKSNKVYDVSHLNKTSSQYFDDFERDLQVWQNDKKENSAEIAIYKLLKYLVKFCEENNLDFMEELAKNDKKNEDRNYH